MGTVRLSLIESYVIEILGPQFRFGTITLRLGAASVSPIALPATYVGFGDDGRKFSSTFSNFADAFFRRHCRINCKQCLTEL
jgi:hypothetical protein